MSAPSESAASPAPCACTNISLMQLFHELKQKFPGVPDHVVSSTIELYCHDKQACETHLHSEVKAALTRAYHASSSTAARHLNELRVQQPGKCRNQSIVKHEASRPTTVQSYTCETPLTAVISSAVKTNESAHINKNVKIPNTDDNQNVLEPAKDVQETRTSPVTIINIDNCITKYSTESPSDAESTNGNTKEFKPNEPSEQLLLKANITEFGSTNYSLLKSNKIRCNLNEKLDKSKEKKTIRKQDDPKQPEQETLRPGLEVLKPKPEELKPGVEALNPGSEVLKPELEALNPEPGVLKSDLEVLKHEPEVLKEPESDPPQEKRPIRPTTLDFIKANPDIAFKPTLKPDSEPCQTVSPSQSQRHETKERNPLNSQGRANPNYPLNFQVNVNCHMDYSRAYDPWLEDYDSPRAITSVNLTVCTPTSNMASPIRETREDDGFEGHVTVTVSPSTARAPRRPAPPPPTRPSRLESPRPTRSAPEPPGSTYDRSLIERQKERLGRLAAALAQEKGRLAQLTRETQILAAPPPPTVVKQRLKDHVEWLREKCDTMAKRLELGGHEPDDSANFYSNIYTGQRPPSSWQCHMCTFRNHPLLDKCEECDMPRILVGTSPSRTHDSGFGSFRDRNRRISSQASQTDLIGGIPNMVEECLSVQN